MSSRKRPPRNTPASRTSKVVMVDSLLDAMQDGNEYGSIVGMMPREGVDLVTETARALEAISTVRCRPCVAYLGNVVRQDAGDSGVDSTDDLPFAEMVNSIPSEQRAVDVLLSTRGGSAQQVVRFVNCLRTRFDEVDFLIPSMCMSAGTLFALSGDRIWMTAQACLGPTDPQIPTKDGRYVPAQALLLLVDKLQRDGAEAMAKGQPVPWTAVRIIDTIDKKELGDAITASNYSSMMVAQFLQQYKFRHWVTRQDSGIAVTDDYRRERAEQIAAALASHDRWKSHGHSISRDVLWDEIKLKIDHPDPTLDRALTRAWALANWLFDKTTVLKIIVSPTYRYVKQSIQTEGQT